MVTSGVGDGGGDENETGTWTLRIEASKGNRERGWEPLHAVATVQTPILPVRSGGGHAEGVTATKEGERDITHWTASLCGSQGGERSSRGGATIRRRAAAHLRVLGKRALINADTAIHR